MEIITPKADPMKENTPLADHYMIRKVTIV